jgi:cellulose synthase/poly-beta-1,6-N-acetylglucosamine synthase-like glycosyltransferase
MMAARSAGGSIMAIDTTVTNTLRNALQNESPLAGQALSCSIGIMAYNEERNIGRLLTALLAQQTARCQIDEILVLASGCTDGTVDIVSGYCLTDPRIKLVVEAERKGKASAVNLFLRHATSDVLVMESADTLPEPATIERLLEPMCDNPDVGMTGGHPVPINDKSTFMGYAVHLLWQLHHQIASKKPKLGELTAFRRVFYRIPYDSAVDEANMEPLITGQGYQLRYVPEAIVYNRGAEAVHDFLKQRRRIHAGHLRMSREQGYTVATMGTGPILSAILANFAWDWRYFCWTPAVIGLEVYGRYLGWMDYRLKKRTHAIWDIAVTTKGEVTGTEQ